MILFRHFVKGGNMNVAFQLFKVIVYFLVISLYFCFHFLCICLVKSAAGRGKKGTD